MPLLSIAIPTFQRKKWLEQCLRRVIEQVEDETIGLVEIIVSDNASKDGSYEWLLGYAKSHPCIKVYHNVTNLGAEGNVRKIPELTDGQYLWLLGDDDFIQPGGLRKVISVLQRGYDYIALNFSPSDENYGSIGKPYWSIPADLEVNSLRECGTYVPHLAFGFLSCWVARKTLFNVTSSLDYDRFKKWGLSILVDRYCAVAVGRRGFILKDSMLTTRKPPIEEYPATFDYFDWFFRGSAEAFRYLLNLNVLTEEEIRVKRAWLLESVALKRILFERASCVFNRVKVLNILKEGYHTHWQYWGLCIPAIYLPGLGLLMRLIRDLRR